MSEVKKCSKRGQLVKCPGCYGFYRILNKDAHERTVAHQRKSLNNKFNEFFMWDTSKA
jgi:hypothetical protein